ncbi:MAG TPA: glycosyltransferase family protein [Polyangiaceae bacterium]|nr:glycosyltransferase family protein [Polyangiaceae bacterium]
MKTLVVVQARMGSTRLPGKVLLPLAGRPLLERMLQRLLAARFPFQVCVATSTAAEDEPIRQLCRRIAVPVVSGHPTDLLERHVAAGRAFGADVVVKIPSDCPLIDPAVVDRVLDYYQARSSDFDFVTNLQPPSWPDGNDVEVVPMRLLEQAAVEATKPFEREHTTPFIWDQPERFRIGNVTWGDGRDLAKSHRFTIDYREDYDFIARIYDELCTAARPVFGLSEILALLAQQPDIMRLNARWVGQSWHLAALGELRSVGLGAHGLEWRSPQ